MVEGHYEAPVWNLGPKIEIPHPENHVLKVFRFRSWKPRVWKSRPQSWDPKSRKPCPENHILKFPRPQSWDPKSWKPCPENHILKFSDQHRWQFRAKRKKKEKRRSYPSRSRNLSGPEFRDFDAQTHILRDFISSIDILALVSNANKTINHKLALIEKEIKNQDRWFQISL